MRTRRLISLFGLLLVSVGPVASLACDRTAPTSTAPIAPPSTSVVASASASSAPSPSASVAPSVSATASASVHATSAVAPLIGADGKPLPQTDEKPSPDSLSFKARNEVLFRAIVDDAPELATPIFFPLVAYQQVKNIPNPPADWKGRLIAAFHRDIHAAHEKMGSTANVKLVSMDVPMADAKWMKPGQEGNKLGYWRVLHAKLRYKDGNDKERVIDVTSLISWRGEWYVVHLTGFK